MRTYISIKTLHTYVLKEPANIIFLHLGQNSFDGVL
jgi:hypothetical protein